MEVAIVVVFVTYWFKHFIADFILQNEYMLGKFQPYPKFILPLSAHCAVHAGIVAWMFFLAVMNGPRDLNLDFLTAGAIVVAYEFFSHFLVDVIKAQWTRITKANHTEHRFWVAIGLDQFAHMIFSIPVVILIAFVLVGK